MMYWTSPYANQTTNHMIPTTTINYLLPFLFLSPLKMFNISQIGSNCSGKQHLTTKFKRKAKIDICLNTPTHFFSSDLDDTQNEPLVVRVDN